MEWILKLLIKKHKNMYYLKINGYYFVFAIKGYIERFVIKNFWDLLKRLNKFRKWIKENKL